MTEQPFRFCPRCGTALVEGMPYCPKCGFNLEDLSRPAVRPSADATSRGDDRRDAPAPRRSTAPLIGAALIVAVGLIGYAVLTRPAPAAQQGGGGPAQGSLASLAPGVTAPPSAPIVGLTIVSPRDGDVVSTEEVTVIGVAPPGLRITRDVSLFPDQHATVDGTGHWAIAVRLDQGDNTLVFRIGDDRSTEQRIRVTYTRPAT